MLARLLRVAFVLFLTSVVLLPVPAVAVDQPADEALAEELRFRHDFGLTTDVATVRNLMANPASYRDWPYALTPAEEAEMSRRLAMEREMGPLEGAAEKLPHFAGHWIDQRAGALSSSPSPQTRRQIARRCRASFRPARRCAWSKCSSRWRSSPPYRVVSHPTRGD